MTSITLLSHQNEHVKNIWKLLTVDQIFSFIDTSNTGDGKTITTLYLAKDLQQKYGTRIMIVAPSDASLNNDDGWLKNAKKYGVEIDIVTTYSALRGGRGTVSHPWLIPDPEDKKNWTTTTQFAEKCASGLFIIFDEYHHAKNASMSHYACAALVKTAKKYRSVCRVGLLSHTPGDKKEHYPQILRMTGLISSKKMFKHIPFTSDYKVEGYGLGELKAVCSKLRPDLKRDFESMMYRLTKARSLSITKDLFDTHISPVITFAMPKRETTQTVKLLNVFLETDEDSLQLLQDGIAGLSGAVNWNAAVGQVGAANTWSLANISNSLKMIERGKLYTMARYVREEVARNPKKKFVISCGARGIEHHDILSQILYRESTAEDYTDIISELRRKNDNWRCLPKDMIYYISLFLKEKVKPHVLNGTVSKKDRIKMIREFQTDTNKCWCLIISPGIGSESISLHDKHGGREREMLIVPDYFHSRVVQSSGRVNRAGMKSDAKVLMVYSKEANLETRILDSMVRKAKIARDLLAEGQEVLFPGEYPFYIEGERDIALETALTTAYRQQVH